MSKEEIAKILKSIRQSAKLTQSQLAEKVGKRQQTIASWEIGQSQPDADTLFLICDICNVSVDDVFHTVRKKNKLTIDSLKIARAYESAEPHIQAAIRAMLKLDDTLEDEERKNA